MAHEHEQPETEGSQEAKQNWSVLAKYSEWESFWHIVMFYFACDNCADSYLFRGFASKNADVFLSLLNFGLATF